MTRLKRILLLVVVCGVGLLLVWQWETVAKLRAENESLRRQIVLWQAQVSGTPPSDNSLTPEQIAELLKLRGEVTQLRGRTNEIALLREQNEKLLAALKDVKVARTNAIEKKSPEDALPQDIHPKDSWAFRGYDSPDATVESVCWALANGDKAAYLAAFAPDMRADTEKHLDGKDFASEANSFIPGEFRILDRQTVSDDEVVVTVYATRMNANGHDDGRDLKNTIFKKIGGEWKVTDEAPPNKP